MNKTISFSLYGNNKKYTIGALKNIPLCKKYYPEWNIRFYYDNTVPKNIINELKKNSEIIDMTTSNLFGMYWRFLILNDPNVDIFIVRDTDSRINKREADAVNEWIKSDKIMHNIRDHPHHYYKVMGGLWGFKNYK